MGKKVILVVDDDPGCRCALAALLLDLGFSVISGTNGQEAIELAVTYKPSVVFMDLSMPEMDGCTATEEIHSFPALAHTPVFAVSANNDAESRTRAFESGMVDFISKPWGRPRIQRALSGFWDEQC